MGKGFSCPVNAYAMQRGNFELLSANLKPHQLQVILIVPPLNIELKQQNILEKSSCKHPNYSLKQLLK